MGCCLSSNGGSPPELESFDHQNSSLGSRAAAEEETVKEVLSETSKPIAKAPNAHIFIPLEEVSKKTQIQEKENLNFNIRAEPKSPETEESASEDVSEICSASLSDRRDDDDGEEEVSQVRQQRVFRSPARSSGSRNRVVSRSRTRKLDHSPSRRNGIGNGGSSMRIAPQTQSRETPMKRGSKSDPPRKKDPVENSGRRSSSPVLNRSIMGRSPSGRSNQSHGYSKKVEQQQGTGTTTMEGKWPSSNNNGGTTTSAPNESLESPFVSFECFIFL